MEVAGGLAALLGLVVCLAGYRVFRAFLATGGLVLGVWLGAALATELRLEGALRFLLVVGLGLLLAWLAAGIYHAGVFIVGGVATAALAAVAGGVLGGVPSATVLAVLFAVGGLLTLLAQRLLVVVVTALVGGLLVAVGMALMMGKVEPPGSISAGWVLGMVGSLSSWQLGVALLLTLVGIFAQRRGHGPRRPRLAFGVSRVTTGAHPASDRAPARRPQQVLRQRTHDSTCPRCGSRVDPEALFCHQCGNDQFG